MNKAQIKVPKRQTFVCLIIDANNKCTLAVPGRLDASCSHIYGGGGVQSSHGVNTHTHSLTNLLYSSTKTNLLTCYRGLCVCSLYMKECLIQLCDASLACFLGLALSAKNLWKRSKMA